MQATEHWQIYVKIDHDTMTSIWDEQIWTEATVLVPCETCAVRKKRRSQNVQPNIFHLCALSSCIIEK